MQRRTLFRSGIAVAVLAMLAGGAWWLADQAAFVAADIAFHRQIAVMSGDSIFPSLVEGILNWLAVHRHELVRAPGAEALTLGEHRKIYEMIAARNPKAAEQAMADHLYRVNIRYGAMR